MKTGVTCLIPFYNEGNRLVDTLNVITQVEGIDKIVCIDDGSDDNTEELLQKHFPHIDLISLAGNQGKTEAIRRGLKSVKNLYTLLLDADLKNLVASEIERAISLMIRKPGIDMLILRRIREPFVVRLLRFDIILSGQRILRTKTLEEILRKDISHYDLEVMMNEYATNHRLKVTLFPISAVNTRRIDKWGIKRSFLTNVYMFKSFAKYPGLTTMFKQILYFARD